MRHEELFYLLALQSAYQVGDIKAKRLINHFGSAREVFAQPAKEIARLEGIGQVISSQVKSKQNLLRAEAELGFIDQSGLQWSTFLDPDYPMRLKHCPDGPILLFKRGAMDLDGRRVISIVGTRKPSGGGVSFCKNLIAELAPLDPVIVSGLAYGIDITAHSAALDHGLQTIGVVAHGLNQVYPKMHRKFADRMYAHGGLLTEFWSTSNPEPENFVKRNRIVAGISEATIVIESAEKGGSLITANLANDYNRDVFAVPGRPDDSVSKGCNDLIKSQRAQLLTSAADLVYQLNWDLKPAPSVQRQLFIDLDEKERKVYDYLFSKGKELLDLIALDCALPVSQLSATLLTMELKGAVRALPGKFFEAI